MLRPLFGKLGLCAVALLFLLASSSSVWAQHTQGRISVTVLDPQKAVVPGAKLELVDPSTNEVRTAQTQSSGTFSFVNLSAGKYKLTITMEGFQKAEYEVVVQTTKSTDIEVDLQIGATTQVVQVEAAVPVVESTQNAIGSVVDMKHIQDLPLLSRNITRFTQLVPGYTGTWNGLPSIAQGNNVDGVIGSPSRMKFGGNANPAVQVRLENIEEMTVQTDQLDLNQGFGMAAMQTNFVTRRGTNAYHGQIFWDHRNDNLNANSWANNTNGNRKAEFKLNEFGGTVGGPILKDKLFFFFSLSTARQPGSSARGNNFLTSSAQGGGYTYVGSDGQTRTVNIFTVAGAYNAANATTLPTTVNSVINAQLGQINQAVQSGVISTTTSLNASRVSWNSLAPITRWFPTLRVDYTPTENWRINLSVNRTKEDNPGANAPIFPGDYFTDLAGGNRSDNFTVSLGIDTTISPTLLNSFRGGYLYNVNFFSYNADRGWEQNPERVPFPAVGVGLASPLNAWQVPITPYYPTFNFSDTLTWQRDKHTLSFGFTFYREQDHYWNPPELTNTALGLVQGDPATDALTNTATYIPLPFASTAQQAEARNLYALLSGRVSNIQGSFPLDPSTGQYIQVRGRYFPLNELAKAWGLFVQDSWRLRSNLTVNGGLRWDFTVASRDIQSAYHNADESSLWGPSGVGNIFMPGTLTGNMNPTLEERPVPYNNWYKSPQPFGGVAWTPQFQQGFLAKLLGDGDTVFRASLALRKFTVPYQYFWNNASDYGSFFYQFYRTTARVSTAPGSFTPGSLSLGQPYPPFLLQPASYQPVAPLATFTFNNTQFSNGANGIEFDINQPYTLTWSFGIQRRLGTSRALEVRYSGNRTRNQWISLNRNEVNVFENGFLSEFQHARTNMAICQANSAGCLAAQTAAGVAASARTTSNFANWGLTGQFAVPILTGAFTGSTTGAQTNAQFRSGTFITQLNTGQVGSMAQTLTTIGAAPFFCNLVGASFTPCATNIGFTGAGAGFPINFFQVNPFASGIPALEMTDEGWSNYNSLQVDFRQRTWHGIYFDANYTWSHTLGTATPNDWTGAYPAYTLRDLKQSYGPTLYDGRHVVNVAGTVDLPFGKGRKFANQGGVVDKIVGGWTVGNILTYRTGYPFRVLGGYNTFNNFADGGVNLIGISRDMLQNSIGVFKKPNQTFVELINPAFRTPGVGANTSLIAANTTPGTFTPPLWIYGPHGFFFDMSLTKVMPITERWTFTFQTQFLNAFNHPVFGQGTTPVGANVRSSGWATATGQTFSGGVGPRQIEFRAKISF